MSTFSKPLSTPCRVVWLSCKAFSSTSFAPQLYWNLGHENYLPPNWIRPKYSKLDSFLSFQYLFFAYNNNFQQRWWLCCSSSNDTRLRVPVLFLHYGYSPFGRSLKPINQKVWWQLLSRGLLYCSFFSPVVHPPMIGSLLLEAGAAFNNGVTFHTVVGFIGFPPLTCTGEIQRVSIVKGSFGFVTFD